VASDERILRGAIIAELGVAARYGHELVATELRAVGVDPDAYGPLSFVGVLQPVTRTRLAQATGWRRTTLRDVVRRLIDRGHVRESAHPRDGRSSLLELTPEGQAIFDRGQPAFKRALDRLDAALGGGLDEHERVVWEIRVALQGLTDARAPAPRAP
jgi:DNA-binding MarR family transcriptional regulator